MADRATSLTPEVGTFRLRLVKGGPWVAARIRHEPTRDPDDGTFLDRSFYWFGDINGENDPNPAPSPNERVHRIWLWGERVAEDEFLFLLRDAEWATNYQPDDPRARPREAVDIRRIRAITP